MQNCVRSSDAVNGSTNPSDAHSVVRHYLLHSSSPTPNLPPLRLFSCVATTRAALFVCYYSSIKNYLSPPLVFRVNNTVHWIPCITLPAQQSVMIFLATKKVVPASFLALNRLHYLLGVYGVTGELCVLIDGRESAAVVSLSVGRSDALTSCVRFVRFVSNCHCTLSRKPHSLWQLPSP